MRFRCRGEAAIGIAVLAQIAFAHHTFARGWVPPLFEEKRLAIENLWKQTPWAKETKDCRGKTSPKWHFEVIPVPFPAVWPPRGDKQIVYYVRAKELCPASFVLGGDVTGPWARIVYSSDGKGTVERLDVSELTAGGIGHRLIKPEGEILESGPSTMGYVASLDSMPDEAEPMVSRTKRFYCWVIPRWRIFLGHDPAVYHEGFLQWLNCPQGTKP